MLKQMRLIHASGFDDAERQSFRLIVFSNIILAMQIIFEVVDQLNIPLDSKSNAVTSIAFVCMEMRAVLISVYAINRSIASYFRM